MQLISEQLNTNKSLNLFQRNMLEKRTRESESAVQSYGAKHFASTSTTSGSHLDVKDEDVSLSIPVLKAGLNMIKPNSHSKETQPSRAEEVRPLPYSSTKRSNRRFRNDETAKVLKQYEARDAKSKSQTHEKKTKLIISAMTSKSSSALTQARERFLERKRQSEQRKSSF